MNDVTDRGIPENKSAGSDSRFMGEMLYHKDVPQPGHSSTKLFSNDSKPTKKSPYDDLAPPLKVDW